MDGMEGAAWGLLISGVVVLLTVGIIWALYKLDEIDEQRIQEKRRLLGAPVNKATKF